MLPLSKKLNEGAEKIYTELCKYYNCEYDDRGNIGKRYRRQDEIGTPYCVTYDFESEEDGAVTVRDRDTMEQERIKIEDLKAYLRKNSNGNFSGAAVKSDFTAAPECLRRKLCYKYRLIPVNLVLLSHHS